MMIYRGHQLCEECHCGSLACKISQLFFQKTQLHIKVIKPFTFIVRSHMMITNNAAGRVIMLRDVCSRPHRTQLSQLRLKGQLMRFDAVPCDPVIYDLSLIGIKNAKHLRMLTLQ